MTAGPFATHGARGRSYIRGGAIIAQGEADEGIVTLGKLDDGTQGLEIANSLGQVTYHVDGDGQDVPFLHLPMGCTGGVSGMAITSTSFGGDGQYLVDFYAIAKRVNLTWAALFPLAATSTMEVRTSFLGPSSTVLDTTYGISSSITGTVDAELPADAIGNTCRLVVEGRRVTGTDILGLSIALQPRNYG